MKLTPLFDRLVVERLAAETTTAGGIVLPDQAVEKPQQGVVLSVGTETKHVKVNDRVMFSKYVGTDIDTGAGTVLVLHEADVLAIVSEVE